VGFGVAERVETEPEEAVLRFPIAVAIEADQRLGRHEGLSTLVDAIEDGRVGRIHELGKHLSPRLADDIPVADHLAVQGVRELEDVLRPRQQRRWHGHLEQEVSTLRFDRAACSKCDVGPFGRFATNGQHASSPAGVDDEILGERRLHASRQ